MLGTSRDLAILRLLDRSTATAAHIRQASVTFGEEPFPSERRVRERMQVLAKQKLVNAYSLAVAGGGLANYYRLAPEGYRLLHGPEAELPHRSYFAELPPSRVFHTLELADVIVHGLVAAHTRRIQITHFHRENELTLAIGEHAVQPDCHMQFRIASRLFNVLFELDRSTEPLDSEAMSSLRRKLLAYEAYQDYTWSLWKQGGKQGARPYFRVAFLTHGTQRGYHLLSLARACARNPARKLCYAATRDEFLASADPLSSPLFLDHAGQWQALVDVHPNSLFQRQPVRLPEMAPVQNVLW